MENVTAFEAKTRFGQLLERVARGEEVIITRHEKPVARLVPEGRGSLEAIHKAVAGLEALRERIGSRTVGHEKLTSADFKDAVAKGRS